MTISSASPQLLGIYRSTPYRTTVESLLFWKDLTGRALFSPLHLQLTCEQPLVPQVLDWTYMPPPEQLFLSATSFAQIDFGQELDPRPLVLGQVISVASWLPV